MKQNIWWETEYLMRNKKCYAKRCKTQNLEAKLSHWIMMRNKKGCETKIFDRKHQGKRKNVQCETMRNDAKRNLWCKIWCETCEILEILFRNEDAKRMRNRSHFASVSHRCEIFFFAKPAHPILYLHICRSLWNTCIRLSFPCGEDCCGKWVIYDNNFTLLTLNN